MSARPKPNEPVTLTRLEHARAVVAWVVTRMPDGEAYLPLFERLDEECGKAARKETSLARVRQLAGERR